MYQITLYTPTYNRYKTLERLYEKLCNQTNKNFYWLIIDDGSIDETKEMVKKWQEDNKIKIHYRYKENGGVHTARDLAYRLIETELLASIDSDDWLEDHAVQSILDCWNQYGGEKYAGIFAPCSLPNGDIYSVFPDVKSASFQEFTFKYRFHSEKITIIRSDVIKQVPASPVYNDEKLVPESYKWIQLPNHLPFLIMKTPLRVYDIQDDGYTHNSKKNFFRNPKGARESHYVHTVNLRYLKPKIKAYIFCIVFSIELRDIKYIRKLPNRLLSIFTFPISILAYFYFKLR